MSDLHEDSLSELREEIARLDARIRALERRGVRFGGSLVGRSRFGSAAVAGEGVLHEGHSETLLPPITTSAPPPPPVAAGTGGTARAVPPPPPPLIQQEPPGATREDQLVTAPQPAMTGVEAAPRTGGDLESNVGLRWVNRIGAITLIFAAAFVFKYAADNGWLGPWARVLTGILAGVLAVGGAELLSRRGHRVVAQGVAGFGIALFYLSFWAAFQVFGLMPRFTLFGLMAAATLLGGVLALRYNAQALAVLAAAGGFLTPVLLSTGERDPWALNAYLLLLAAGAVFLAVKKRWPGLAWMAFLGTNALYWAAVIDDEGKAPFHPDLLFGVLYYALFLSTPWRAIAALAQISFGFAILSLSIWVSSSSWTWQIVLPLIAGLVVASYRKRAIEAVAAMLTAHAISSYGLSLMFTIGLDRTIPKDALGFLTLVSIWVLFSVWTIRFWLRWQKTLPENAAGAFAINSLAFAGTGIALIEAAGWQVSAGFLFLLAAAHLALNLPAVESLVETGRYRPLALVARGLAVFYFAAAIPVQLHGPLVAVIWSGMGLVLAWASATRRALWMEAASYVLFFSSLVRLLSDDWPAADAAAAPFAHGLFFAAILVGAAMLAAAWLWRNRIHRWAAAFAGHFTILLALIVETIRWGERGAPGGDALIFETAMISAILSVYAVILVGAGVAARSRANRIAGLALLLLVAAKLYLFDVWLLDTPFRIVAFGVLGSMLLATSFLYSRLKGAVRGLLQREKTDPAPAGDAGLSE